MRHSETNAHYYFTDEAEIAHAETLSYILDDPPVQCSVYTTQFGGAVPLHHLYKDEYTDHFYTTSDKQRKEAESGGYEYIGITCYVNAKAGRVTSLLFRCYRPWRDSGSWIGDIVLVSPKS